MNVSLGALRDMDDAQLESTLLRSCLALPKVSFVLRACPPSHLSHSSSEFDSAIRRTLESIIGGPVSDWSWLKATLPSSCGGLNFRSASRHAPAAFLSSYSASLPLVELILGHPPGKRLGTGMIPTTFHPIRRRQLLIINFYIPVYTAFFAHARYALHGPL